MTSTKKDDKSNAEEETKSASPGKKTLSLGGTLSLKGGASVQKPSAGSGGVAVETRSRKRSAPTPKDTQADDVVHDDANADINLTERERQARLKALEQAKTDGSSRKSLPKRAPTQNKPEKSSAPESADEIRAKELAELERIQKEEELYKAEQAAQARSKKAPHSSSTHTPGPAAGPVAGESETSYRDRIKKAATKAPAKPRGNDDRRRSRITVTQAINNDYDRDRSQSLAAQRRAKEKARLAAMGAKEPAAKVVREVVLPEAITVQELANRMAEAGGEVVKAMMKLGVMATINQTIDADTAELIIEDFGHKVKRVTEADVEIGLEGTDDNEKDLLPRPPVVTIMGHVDHGKTSLLDALRSTDVVGGEAGGITQHIGAYQVTMESGDKITFLDTPGHAAFTEMRSRGAQATDIVIIVVSATDSIMPQTIEAINHAKAAEVPIIIAVNKIDLPDADPKKVKTDLLQYEVIVEELSGDVQCVEISAKERINLDKLEEAIILQSEILDLKANPDREAQGVIVESKQERGRGSVATVLIQRGTLHIGDVFVAGAETGRVRAIINDHGNNISKALPGQPVEVLGINATPDSGEQFIVVKEEAKAREISEYRQRKKREVLAAIAVKGRTTLEDLITIREEGEKTKLPVIIKADVHGSVEALTSSLKKLEEDNEGIEVKILHTGVGGITESDVTLARASGALIVGFNVRANVQARAAATRDGVDIRYYNVIYNVVDDAKDILSGMLEPTIREEYIGQAKILQVFNITKVGKVAGCNVEEGAVRRGNKVRLLRDDVVIHEGMLKTLQRFKDEVPEVKEGTECGMAFEKYEDIRAGDIIECFDLIEEERIVE